MKQLVQPISGGGVRLIDVPAPSIDATEVLVQTVASVVSPGTEGAVTALARSHLLAKARARPDLVRQVVRRARTEGLAQTARKVRARLEGDVPLGYSAAGVVMQVGEAVSGISPGQLVATAGAGKANHAEFQAVPGLLCAAVPSGVAAEDAAYSTIASIAMHGLRLAEVGPGSKVVVIGLGLVGQLSARLALAAGCEVAGIDVASFPVEAATRSGAFALIDEGDATTQAVRAWSRGRGADAVLVTAATSSSAAMGRAPELCRDRAAVVVVGDVGLDLDRTPFYERELTIRFARSYGPGRHELTYEQWGVDYPPGFVRWTEGRNLEAVLDLIASRRLEVSDLTTHRFSLTDGTKAYDLIESRREPFLGIAISYPAAPRRDQAIVLRSPTSISSPGIGLVGAGAFATTVLVPALKKAGFERFVAVTSASGLSARRLAERAGFEKAVSSAAPVIDDPAVDVVVIATPHDTHAALAISALRARKHVWCEKPLTLTLDELDEVERVRAEADRLLFVGYNRRYAKATALVRDHFRDRSSPLVITYRVNAGILPDDHWYKDRRQGGRLIGEACHFVDLCEVLVGSPAQESLAIGGGHDASVLTEDFVIALRYEDGSVATISYATGGPLKLAKERIDVLGAGRSAAIDDFREVSLDGSTTKFSSDPKGHEAAARALFAAVAKGAAEPFPLTSHAATLSAAASLRGSTPTSSPR